VSVFAGGVGQDVPPNALLPV